MNWLEFAACKGQDVNKFSTVDYDHPEGVGVPIFDHLEITRKNFEEAKATFCDVCPVLFECRESAGKADLENTLRGGVIPLRIRASYAPTDEVPNNFNKPCKRGHIDRDHRGRCRICHRTHQRLRRAEETQKRREARGE